VFMCACLCVCVHVRARVRVSITVLMIIINQLHYGTRTNIWELHNQSEQNTMKDK